MGCGGIGGGLRGLLPWPICGFSRVPLRGAALQRRKRSVRVWQASARDGGKKLRAPPHCHLAKRASVLLPGKHTVHAATSKAPCPQSRPMCLRPCRTQEAARTARHDMPPTCRPPWPAPRHRRALQSRPGGHAAAAPELRPIAPSDLAGAEPEQVPASRGTPSGSAPLRRRRQSRPTSRRESFVA